MSQRYIEEMQHTKRLTYHAQRMPYPQFRDSLLKIADDKSKHAEWIAEKIRALGGTLPQVPEISLSGRNSWQNLLEHLEGHRRGAAQLLSHIYTLRAEYPDAADLLQRIYDDGARQREEIRKMLMRSDPQAHWTG